MLPKGTTGTQFRRSKVRSHGLEGLQGANSGRAGSSSMTGSSDLEFQRYCRSGGLAVADLRYRNFSKISDL